MCHMGANLNMPKCAEKYGGSFYKKRFSIFWRESTFRSDNESKLATFGPKYVFFAILVPLGASHGNKIKIFRSRIVRRIFFIYLLFVYLTMPVFSSWLKFWYQKGFFCMLHIWGVTLQKSSCIFLIFIWWNFAILDL